MSAKKYSVRVTLFSLLVYALLVASHKGEYWPFSIYPMFSQAGNPWTRALVQDVTNTPDSLLWDTTTPENLPGEPVALASIGVDQIDYSNFVSKTKNWNEQRTSALRTMLGEQYLTSEDWMIYKVKGKLIGSDSVVVEVIPYLLFKADTTLLNPDLLTSDYVSE